jgi:hypothetical protein
MKALGSLSEGLHSLFPDPGQTDELIPITISKIEITLIGAFQGLANPSGHMDTGGCYQGLTFLGGNSHQPFHRTFTLFLGLSIVNQVQHLLLMAVEETSFYLQITGWITILNTLAGRTDDFIGIVGRLIPGPPSSKKYGPAFGADRGLGPFLFFPVGVMPLLLDQLVLSSLFQVHPSLIFVHKNPPCTLSLPAIHAP